MASAEKTASTADLDTRYEDGVDTCIQVISCQTALLQTSVTTLKSRAGASNSAPPAGQISRERLGCVTAAAMNGERFRNMPKVTIAKSRDEPGAAFVVISGIG